MSIPIMCSCGTLIGEREGLDAVVFGLMDQVFRPCPGQHSLPEKTSKKKWLGLIRETTIYYPETGTTVIYEEYIGPTSRFWLKIAFLGSRHHPNGAPECLLVNGKLTWWKFGRGFYGDPLPF